MKFRCFRRWTCPVAGILCFACAPSYGSAEPFLHPAKPESPPVTSYSQRFVFRGFDSRDNAMLGPWTEETTRRLEKVLGLVTPFKSFEVVRITGSSGPAGQPGRIHLGQTFFDEFLQQRIAIENPQNLSQEQLLEALVKVHLNRYIVATWKKLGPSEAKMLLPDWFSVGLAQSLLPEVNARNKAFVGEAWNRDDTRSVDFLLKLQTLPPDPVPDKAWCGVFVSWLLKVIPDTIGWDGFFTHVAKGGLLDSEWLTSSVMPKNQLRDVEKTWDLELASLVETHDFLGRADPEAVAALKKALEIYPGDFGRIPDAGLPHLMMPRDLISYGGERWVTQVCGDKIAELNRVSAGKAPELVAVANRYRGFFRMLISVSGGTGAKRGKISALEEAVDEADSALSGLGRDAEVRAEYLQGVETGRPAVEPTSPVGDPQPSLEEKRRQYLNALEQQDGSPGSSGTIP